MLDKIVYIFDCVIGFFKPKYRYYKDRRDTKLYKKKKEIVKSVWIVSGFIMLLFASHPQFIGIILIISMCTTIVAFMILDETYYPRDEE